jgi:hypothetical protein
MAIKTYDPKSVAIIFGGIIITGWNSVSVEYEEDSYEHSVGADGEEMRTKKNDNRASMTLTLAQSSASNDALSLVAAADRASNGGVLPMLIKDNTGRSLVESESAWIKKTPSFNREAGPSDVEWMFSLSNAIMFHGGH